MRRLSLITAIAALLLGGLAYAQCPTGDYDTLSVQELTLLGYAAEGDTVFIDSLVVTGRGDDGLWVSEPGDSSIPFGGVYVYSYYEFDPGAFARGDLVYVIGEYDEFSSGCPIGDELSEIRTYGGRGCVVKIAETTVPEPPLLKTCDINLDNTQNPNAEKWEGSLVVVDSVMVVADDLPYGEWQVVEADADQGCGANDTLWLDTEAASPIAIPDSGSIVTITGALHYNPFDCHYSLQPRNNADIQYPGLPPGPKTRFVYPTDDTHLVVVFDRELEEASAENVNNYYEKNLWFDITSATLNADLVSVTLVTDDLSTYADSTVSRILVVENVRNQEGQAMEVANEEVFIPGVKDCAFAFNDSATIGAGPACVCAIVTGAPNESSYGNYLYIQDRSGFGYALRVEVSYYEGGVDTLIARGDSVLVAGQLTWYYRNVEMYRYAVDHLAIISTGHTVPSPVVVDIQDVNNQPSPPYEPSEYGNKLIRFENLSVYHDSVGYGTYTIKDGPDLTGTGSAPIGFTGVDTIGVDDFFFPGTRPYHPNEDPAQRPSVGDSLLYIQGVLNYSYEHYNIHPRAMDDIDIYGITGVEENVPVAVNSLQQNRPNPFNPTTTIEFSLAKRGKVDLKVYDTAGRVVRTLESGVRNAGVHTVVWDGRNNQGQDVSSGIYFYRVQADDFVGTKKMVLLR